MAISEPPLFQAWDIVVVPFPYADRLAEKRRPALVISTPSLAQYGVVWTAMITSADNEPWPCDVPVPNRRESGLAAPSVVRPAKIACIDPSRVIRKIGRLERGAARTVAAKLAEFFAK
jgi:mRNA interferase MazF